MKASDIEVGKDYAYTRSDDIRWNVRRVRVVETPVHPWHKRHTWANTRGTAPRGVDTSAKKTHSLVTYVDIGGVVDIATDRVLNRHIRYEWSEYLELKERRERLQEELHTQRKQEQADIADFRADLEELIGSEIARSYATLTWRTPALREWFQHVIETGETP